MALAPSDSSHVEVGIEAIEDRALKRLVAAGAFGAEAIELAVPPDHAAREQHRAASAIALLVDLDGRAVRARLRSRHEPRHAGSGHYEVGQTREKVGLCSTYSSLMRSGPQTKTANVLAASRTSATSMPRRFASSSCS